MKCSARTARAYNNAEDSSELAKLVHDMRCKRADEMQIKQLAERTRYFKETQEGVSDMCKAIEELRSEAARYEKIQIAVNLLSLGACSEEKIAEATGLTPEEVHELSEQLHNVTA